MKRGGKACTCRRGSKGRAYWSITTLVTSGQISSLFFYLGMVGGAERRGGAWNGCLFGWRKGALEGEPHVYAWERGWDPERGCCCTAFPYELAHSVRMHGSLLSWGATCSVWLGRWQPPDLCVCEIAALTVRPPHVLMYMNVYG